MQPARPRYYRFGPNVLDCLRSVLWQHGVEVPLTPRVFDILRTLVQHQGELVTKDDFMRLVWGGVAVEDNNLARQISTLRKLLHERPGQREYIATVTGVGYRFVGEVTTFDELPDDVRGEIEVAAGHAAPVINTPSDAAAPPAISEKTPDPEAAQAPVPAPAPTAPAPLEPPVPATTPWAAVVAGGLALAAGLLLFVGRDEPASAANVSRTLWQFTHDEGSQSQPAWSPDGRRLAVVVDRGGNADIWVHAVEDPARTPITSSPAHDWQPHWSPDGQQIVFRSERDGGGIYVVPASGGEERRLASFGSHPQWSPDGRHVLFSQTAPDASVAVKLFVVPAAGGAPQRVMHPALAGLQVTSAAWAPDGRISVWTRDEEGGRSFLTFPLGDGPATVSALPAEFATDAAKTELKSFTWASSGRYLYFEGRTRNVRNIWRVTVAPTTLDWAGRPEQLTVGPGADISPAVSPDGTRLSFGVNTARPGIWGFRFDAKTGQLEPTGEQVVSGVSGEGGADVTRDGRHLVYRIDRDNRQEIWERAIDGEPRLLVSERHRDVSVPRWSPDQTHIVYRRQTRPNRGVREHKSIALLDVSRPGAEPFDLLTLGEGEEGIPTDWRPDGQAILTGCRLKPGEALGICEVPVTRAAGAGRGPEPVQHRLALDTARSLYQQRYSPNQRWISFMAVPRADRSASTIYVMPATGGPWHPVTDGQAYDDKPRWSRDGRTLYFISNRDGRFEVWRRGFDPETGRLDTPATRVTNLQAARQTLSPYLAEMEMFVTPDRIFLPMFEASSRIWMLDHADR